MFLTFPSGLFEGACLKAYLSMAPGVPRPKVASPLYLGPVNQSVRYTKDAKKHVRGQQLLWNTLGI